MEGRDTSTDNVTGLDPDLEEQTLSEFYCNMTELALEVFDFPYCNATWDQLSCWPATLANTTAILPCFSELNGVKYDVSGNASKECFENGTWDRSNYKDCSPIIAPKDEYLEVLWDMRDAVTVYYVGYGFSLIAITLALWIFICFKELRCLRNTIHTHLMVTYLLLDITWILTANLQSSNNYVSSKMACYLTVVLTYLMGTNFFWMFVEGLYLFILVVKTFSVDNIKMQFYATIGWVVPAIIAATWATVKGYFTNSIDDYLAPQGCPWQKRDLYDYIFIAPVLLVLLINILFLSKIMWVLITKLRATNTVESEQYRKAAKALLVLIPLLGVTYVLVIATPNHRMGEVVFTFLQACLLSLQGLIVSVLYCFLNGEVQNTLKHRLERWKDRQNVNRGQHQSLHHRSSPDSKTFYRGREIRDSSISFATSTSLVNCASSVRSPSFPTVTKFDCINATAEEKNTHQGRYSVIK